MRIVVVALILTLAPIASAAQQVSVRSGDHDTFTRFVFRLPSRVDWSLQNTDNRAVIRFESGSLDFDTSSVFERIQKDRVSEIVVDQDAQTVALKFACDCEASGFWFDQSMLVVDVAQSKKTNMSQLRTASSSEVLREVSQTEASDEATLSLLLQTGSTSAALVQNALGDVRNIPHPSRVLDSQSGSSQTIPLEESRDQLLKQIGRAASQGLLSPQPDSRGDEKQASTSDETERSAQPILAEDPPARVPDQPKANIQINVQTSIDRDFLADLSGRDQGILSGGCLDPKLLNVAAWGFDAPFWEQVGPLRSSMTSEFDRTDDRVVLQLAQTYIFFGFGLEAAQVADMLSPDAQSTSVLKALASIMNTGSAPGSVLNGQLECNAPGALWSALSHPTLPKNARLDKDGIIRSFSALPPHLRTHLGPILSSRFLEAGHEDESALILRNLDRVAETQTPASDFVAAEIELAQGEQAQGEDILETVIEANDVMSPDALVLQIDSQIGRGDDVSFDLAQLAAAYAFEYAGTPTGAKLARSHILALGASGAFEEAYSELNRLNGDTVSQIGQIRAELSALMALRATQIDFLQHVLAGDIGDVTQLPQETALKIAERLIEAGFYNQSQHTLARTFKGQFAREARLLRAQAALATDRPKQAEVELLGLTGQDANTLRARARSMAGEHKQAYELFKSAGLTEEADREAWLADDWSTASSEVAATQIEIPPEGAEAASEEIGLLAQNRALLDDVGTTRDRLQALLSEAPAPVLEN